MPPPGTAAVRCLLFINQGEQREASRVLALAIDPGKEGGGGQVPLGTPGKAGRLLWFVFSFPKSPFRLGENALNVRLQVTSK